MPGWEEILKNVIPSAGGVITTALSNQAQQQGIGASREALQNAYNQSQSSIANATQQAAPYAASTYNQNVGNLGTSYGNALTNAQWGLDQSTQLKQQGLNNALATGQQGFNAAQGAYAPYAQLGNNALSALSSHVLGAKGAIPQQQWQQPSFNLPQMNLSVGKLPTQQPFNVNQAPANPSAIGQNAMTAGIGSTQTGFGGAGGALGGSSTNSMIGGLVGTGIGAGLSALGLATASIPLLAAVPFVGPLLAGAGALIGALWNNHNPDKAWASNAIDEARKQMWGPNMDGNGGVIQAVKTGQITAEQGKAVYQGLFNGWIQAMKNAGLNDGIIQSSIDSQQQYWATTPQIIDQAAANAPKQTAGAGTTSGQTATTARQGGWPQ